MDPVIVGIVVSLAAGFAFGALRQQLPALRPLSPRARNRMKAALVLVLFGVPAATLMLAQALDSAVLGWVFGLTLMVGAAVVLPGAALFWLGMKLNTWLRPTRPAPRVEASSLAVDVERDGVHPSDDAPTRRLAIPSDATLRTMLQHALAGGYLPGISGGKATWIVESTCADAGTAFVPIAVCAQQWAEPAFLIPPETSLAAHFGNAAPRLNFRYRRQEDPDAVLADTRVTRAGRTGSDCRPDR